MIRPLRKRHRAMIGVLGVVLPVAFVAGIAARKPLPTMATLPSAVVGDQPRFESLVWERDELWTQRPIRTRLVIDQMNRQAVELSAAKDIARPDLIVYWAPGDPKLSEKLPDDAVLLGAYGNNSALPLPAEAGKRNGVLVLYSLADHEIVAASKFFETADRRQ